MKKCPGCSTIWLKYRRIWRRRAWLGTMTKITSDFHFHYEESSREEEGFHYFPVHKSLVEKSLLFVVILIAGWPGCVWLASILEVWWCWWPFGRHWVPPFSSPPRLSCHALKASWPARQNKRNQFPEWNNLHFSISVRRRMVKNARFHLSFFLVLDMSVREQPWHNTEF